MKRVMLTLLVVCLTFFVAGAALADGADKAPDTSAGLSRAGYVSLGLSGGYMFDPEMAAGLFSLDYYITDDMSVGPAFQFGGAGGNNYWGVSGQFKYAPALANNPKARPYGTVGIGFMDLDFEDRDDDDMSYLFPVGGGLEFEVHDIVSLDVGGLFNIAEDSFVGLLVGCRVVL